MAYPKSLTPKSLIGLFDQPLSWIIIVVLTLVFLRLPTLFEPHRYADEEIYLVLGQALRRGLVFYRDIHDNKPPLIYLLAALANGSVAYFRLILLAWNAVNVFLFNLLVKSIMPKNKTWPVGLITFLFAVLTSLPLTEGNIVNGEIFMIMPATLGAYLLWRYRLKRPPLVFLLAGFSFSLAFLFKVPIIFDLIGIGIFLAFGTAKTFKEKIGFFTSPGFCLLILGFITPILISIVYYYLQGAAQPYVKAALLQNVGYLSSWENKQTNPLLNLIYSGLFQRTSILLALTLVLLLIQKRLRRSVLFVSLWFVFSLFGALLSGRPYPHYLIEVIPSLVLAIGLFISKGIKDKLALLMILIMLPISVWYYHFWYYKSWPYYQNFGSYILGQKDKEQYYGFFDGVNRNYKVAGYVINHSHPNEKIFVWGTEPAIYALTNRLPVGRYPVAYHIADFNAWEETMRALNKEKPSLIVKMLNETKAFPQLDALLASYYLPVETINEAFIYRRLY